MFETAAVPRVSSPSFCFSSSAVSRCGVEVLEGGRGEGLRKDISQKPTLVNVGYGGA